MKFAQAEIAPRAAQVDKDNDFPSVSESAEIFNKFFLNLIV